MMQTLKDSEIRYRRLFETAQDGILILDAKTGMIEDVNPYLIKMLGYSREEIVEKKLWEVGAFADIEASQDAFKALQENEYIRYEDLPLRAKDGRLIQVEFVSNVYLVGGEKVIQCDIRDVTEHRRIITALQKNERKYRDLVNLSPDGMFIIASSGRILTANTAMCTKLGFSEEELLFMNIWDIIPEQYLDQYRSRLTRILAGESLVEDITEYAVHGKYGTIHYIEVLSAPHYSDKDIIGFQGIARDITARKQMERALRIRTEDLALVNALNDAANHGMNITDLVKILTRELENMIPAYRSASIYLLDSNAKYLELQNISLSAPLIEKVEHLIGRPIPKIKIPIQKESYFHKIAGNEQGSITSDPKIIQQWITEFTETVFLSPLVRNQLKTFVPLIYKLLNIKSMATVPLISSGRVIGLLEVSTNRSVIAEDDMKRIRNISGQLTPVILRKQAEERIQRQLEHLTALSAIDRVIAASFNLKFNLSEILKHLTIELDIDAADIQVLNPHLQILEYGDGCGFRTNAIKKAQIRLGESYAGRVALAHQLIHIPNLRDEPDNLRLTNLLKDEGFVCYFGVPLIAKGQVEGVLEVFHRSPLEPDAEWLDLLNTIAGQAAIAIENVSLFESLQRSKLELILAYDATIEGWSHALELRDMETKGHTLRVTEMILKLARATGITEEELIHVRRGALLHDIGKMGVPDNILLKPGKLTDEEWVAMRKHPTIAFELLSPIAYLHPALDIPYCHHERWDGTGYPRGLKGDQIPLVARLFAVVDVWDALRSNRPYHPAWSKEKVREHIKSLGGTHFDPKIVELFLEFDVETKEKNNNEQ